MGRKINFCWLMIDRRSYFKRWISGSVGWKGDGVGDGGAAMVEVKVVVVMAEGRRRW